MSNENQCDCITWGNDGSKSKLRLSHHPNCKKYDAENELKELLVKLVDGIEWWANDCDGVHPDCWKAYVKACHVLGVPNRPSQIDEAIGLVK